MHVTSQCPRGVSRVGQADVDRRGSEDSSTVCLHADAKVLLYVYNPQ
jgi:hypothetical protein